MPEKKESYSSILTNAIINWMKKHVHQYIPSYKEIAKDLIDIPNLLPIFSACKKKAFKELQSRGFILEFSPEPKTCNARIIGYKPPDGIGKRVAEKVLGIEEETSPEPKPAGVKWHEDIPKLKTTVKPIEKSGPFTFCLIKAGADPSELETLGNYLIKLANTLKVSKVDIKVKITEGGEQG